jgi:exoribonuclease R
VLVACAALLRGEPVPDWVRQALPTLPKIMNRTDGLASRLEHASVDAIEAALLRDRVGESFEAVVISPGRVQLADPPITATLDGDAEPGQRLRVELVEADIASGVTRFRNARR